MTSHKWHTKVVKSARCAISKVVVCADFFRRMVVRGDGLCYIRNTWHLLFPRDYAEGKEDLRMFRENGRRKWGEGDTVCPYEVFRCVVPRIHFTNPLLGTHHENYISCKKKKILEASRSFPHFCLFNLKSNWIVSYKRFLITCILIITLHTVLIIHYTCGVYISSV